jgi:triacylglycerol lipase
MLRSIALLTAGLALAGATTAAADAAPARGPALTTSSERLRAALTCEGKLAGARRDPVLLVHGTFGDGAINWSWNYQRVLPTRGRAACTVDLPGKGTGDAQLATEYVVHAIRSLARRSGRRVAVIGHSQGGLEARWALRWWPELRRRVSDVVTLATPNHGSSFTNQLCTAPRSCAAALFQMRTDSAFLRALNRGRETIRGVAFTAVSTADDRIFVTPAEAALQGGSNIVVQRLCPGHRVDHVGLAFDGPTFAIAMDALDHSGPAKLRRIDRAVCRTDTMPGVSRPEADAKLAEYAAILDAALGPNGPRAEGEPPAACYVRARRGRRCG